MKSIVKALYNEPVFFYGCAVAITAVLGQYDVIATWITAAVAAIGLPITRQFSTPAKTKH